MGDFETWVSEELENIEKKHLVRTAAVSPDLCYAGKGALLNFSSNDYLGFSRSSGFGQAAPDYSVHGSGASRVVTGTFPVHIELEEALASWFGYDAALVFGSGYLANIGVLSALIARGDAVFADRLVHASLVDGIQLSRAAMHRFRHNDIDHLEQLLIEASGNRKPKEKFFIVTESLFSMDGDRASVADLADIAQRFDAQLIVDEAHAVGVFGSGRGISALAGVAQESMILLGTLSKAFGSYGGFCCTTKPVKRLLINRARSFIYSTAPPPLVMQAGKASLEKLSLNPSIGLELLARAEKFREMLRSIGYDTLNSGSQIIPLCVGGNERTIQLAQQLLSQGIRALAVRSPTVRQGTERLRLSVCLSHSSAELEHAAEVIGRVGKHLGVV